MDFALLILVTAILRIRPTDIVSGLEDVPLYEVAILGCLLFSFDKLSSELQAVFSGRRPIASFMLGILVLIPISDAIHGEVELGLVSALEYFKVLVYFMLLVGIVNSPRRLRWFIIGLILIDLVPTSLALLDYYGYLSIPAYEDPLHGMSPEYDAASDRVIMVRRLIASGMFGDPNDFCEILNTGLMFCLGGLLEKAAGLARLVWLAPIATFCFAVWKTGSRGGLLGTIGGLGVLFWSRFGRRKAIIAALLAAPLFAFFVSGRMAHLSASEGTGRTRVIIWQEGFAAWRQSPIIVGIGASRFHSAVVGKATHNAFLCAFAELGFVGGACLLGAYYYALANLWKLGAPGFFIEDPQVRRLRPYILAALVSYSINEMSLTHPYNVVTYMMLGVASACISLADPQGARHEARFSGRLLFRVMMISVVFVIGLFIFMKFSLRGQ